MSARASAASRGICTPRRGAPTATVFHAEFAEGRGVRGALVRESLATAEVHPRVGAQRFCGAEHAEGRGAAEDCSPGRDLFAAQRSSPSTTPKSRTLGSAFGRSRWRGLPRSSANSAGRGGGDIQGTALRELRVNHVAHRCESAERVQIPRLRAARSARDDNRRSAARRSARGGSDYGAPAIRFETPGGVRRSRRTGGTVTPPETMNAITSALSASRMVTAVAGKIMSWPAKLYDCGM